MNDSMWFNAFLVLIAFILVIMITSCTNEPLRQFNSDDQQDNSCYNEFKGLHGYCDMRGNPK